MKAERNARTKMWLARLTIIAILAGGAYGILKGYEWFSHKGITIKSAEAGVFNNPDTAELAQKAEEIAHQREIQAKLPETSILARLGLTWISEDKKSSEEEIQEMTVSLGKDISENDAMEPIRKLRTLREQTDRFSAQTRSSEPAIQAEAKMLLAESRRQQKELEKEAHHRFKANGVNLTVEQVSSLGASPNAEDLASMISAFATLKEVNAQMEANLRKNPSQEKAENYYASHLVLLNALNSIQMNAINNIKGVHLAKAQQIGAEAIITADTARSLLNDGHDNISKNEKTALKWNIESCKKTVELSERTQHKLNANLQIIEKANVKLAGSIATAENCHMTARLQNEILTLENSGGAEIAKIEALTVPQLAAVNFADPENLEVSK